MITRRGALLVGSGAILSGRLGFAASEPWKDKKPKNWSESDVRVILNKSPWAKQARAEVDPELAGGPLGRGGPDGGPPPDGGPGGGFPPGGPPGGGFPGGVSESLEMKLTVRWDSARPVRIAAKSDLDDFAEKYIITVSGLPAMTEGSRARGPIPDFSSAGMVERLKAVSKLQIKGRDPIGAEEVGVLDTPGGQTIRVAFSRGQQPIQLSDKIVTFSTQVGPAGIKANFILKDMVFEGKLEL